LPSRSETFGVVYVEAIACGKPVLATRCGGPESIVTAENGLLVDTGDVDALAGAMRTMTATARSYDAHAIRRQFLERFSRAAVVDRLEDVYVRAKSA
jgi:glycosyltransferase involved in cell wall biosynthesis